MWGLLTRFIVSKISNHSDVTMIDTIIMSFELKRTVNLWEHLILEYPALII